MTLRVVTWQATDVEVVDGATLVGAASTALRDGSDATYVEIVSPDDDFAFVVANYPAPALPGWVLVSMGFELRGASYQTDTDVPGDRLLFDVVIYDGDAFGVSIISMLPTSSAGLVPATYSGSGPVDTTVTTGDYEFFVGGNAANWVDDGFINIQSEILFPPGGLRVHELTITWTFEDNELTTRTPLRTRQRASGVTGSTPLRSRANAPAGLRTRQDSNI